MKIYQVITKVFYKCSDNKEYQVADALEPIQTRSNLKKAKSDYYYWIKYYQRLGYVFPQHPSLFPMLNITGRRADYRVVIYILESEVE